ncbi:MAG: putative rane protein [Rhizobacter sp.]|nr:putative rane protein [Rhizobacter sp.]
MSKYTDHRGTPLIGLASGVAAGVVGALVMTGFQALLSRANITSGVKGAPSTEKAADRLSRLTTGRTPGLSTRPVAGEAIHYAVGGMVGGLYGMVADIEPRITAGQGTAFGVAAATVVDEGLVPALGLGDPVWKAPLISHPYSYASHTVFGVSTEVARKLFHRFFDNVKAGVEVLRRGDPKPKLETDGPRQWRTLGLAFMLGATAGPRTTAPLVTVTWAARLGWIDVKDSKLAFLASPKAALMVTPMAVGEFVADKLPSTPDRTEAAGVIGRATTGAMSGAALVGGKSASAALAGAAGAIAATYLGHTIRGRLSKSLGKDWPVAGAEDLLAFGGAFLVVLAALAPKKVGPTIVEMHESTID